MSTLSIEKWYTHWTDNAAKMRDTVTARSGWLCLTLAAKGLYILSQKAAVTRGASE